MIPVRSTHQLSGDAQTVVSFSHAALENGAHVQFLSDGAWVDLFVLERETRTSGYDAEVLDLRKGVDDFFGNTVGEVFVLLVRAHVHERQDHNRIACRKRDRDTACRYRCDQTVASLGDHLDNA